MHVAAVVIGVFSCYQLYCNIEAGVDFMSSIAYLVIGIVAIAVCEKVATLGRTKMMQEQNENQQAMDTTTQPAVEEGKMLLKNAGLRKLSLLLTQR